ncbi:MAG: hypothetical protein H7288_14765 [Kineosporiaceae bacterium]|nr:hypothetical protein [Aeromicrobium sp.]
MSTQRTITGNLAADVEVVKAGSIGITKFRVIENTGEYRAGRYLEHVDSTTEWPTRRARSVSHVTFRPGPASTAKVTSSSA